MNDELNDRQQPYRPPFRGQNRYTTFKDDQQKTEEPPKPITQAIIRKDLFAVTITAATHNGGNMNNQAAPEQKFIIDLIFKPVEPGFKIRPEEAQLLLAHLGEILREFENDREPSNE
jgi:hypothetical protein